MRPFHPQDIAALHAWTAASRRVTVTVHVHPDGDAAGSGLALVRFLRALGKDAALVFPDPLPDTLRFLLESGDLVYDGVSQPEESRRHIAGSDLLFSLDYNQFYRTETLAPWLEQAGGKKVLIDHHLDPDRASFGLCFSETEVSSTCEILYRLLLTFPQTGGDPSRLQEGVRTALMTGMTTDTNNFANSVWPGTLDMASGLLDAGTDRDMILDRLYHRARENRLRLMGYLLYEAMEITPEGAAILILDKALQQRFGILEGETEGFVNLPLALEKVRMSFFLKEEDGLMRVSIRSRRDIAADRCAARYFHGGGHPCASGGKLRWPEDIAAPEETAGYVRRISRDFLKNEVK